MRFQHPAVPYVAPFAIFMALMALQSALGLPALADNILRLVVMAVVIWLIARPVLDLRAPSWAGSIALGALIAAIWVLPDVLIPGYRRSILFENSVLGKVAATLPEADRANILILVLRSFRAVVIVPIVEELFWRGWMMRWLIKPEFEQVPLGAYAAQAFWITAALFALEHGSFWDVGLIAGILFNAWMVRTKSLGDLILSHAAANAFLSAYVIAAGKWEYWP